MPKILTGQYTSRQGKTCVVEIYDEEGVASADEFQVTRRATWNWDGSPKDIFEAIKPLNFTVEINIPATGAPRTFVNNLIAETDEHRFWLKFTRDSVELFRGWIQIDQSSIPIRTLNDYPFTLRASDSLGFLGNYDYIDPATPDTPYRNAESVKDHLIKILKSANIEEMYGASDPFLSISTVYHNSLMPNTTDDYAARILVDHRHFAAELEEQFSDVVFLENTSLGFQPTEPGNARETLERLCFQFNAVFFHANGHYYFISRERFLTGGTIPLWTYKTDGTILNTTGESNSITIGDKLTNNTGYLIWKDSGTYTFLTPIKELIIDHQKGGGNNKIINQEWAIENHPEVCFDEINNQGNATVVAQFNLNYSVKNISGAPDQTFRMWIGLIIKIGTQYLHRDFESGHDIWSNDVFNYPGAEVPYQDPAWSAVFGYYNIVVDVRSDDVFHFSGDRYIFIQDIESPVIPEKGQLCVDVVFLELRNFDSNAPLFDNQWDEVVFSDEDTFTIGGNTYDLFWIFKDNYLQIASDEDSLNEDSLAYTRYTAKVNIRNSEKLEFSTGMGDDPGSNTHGRLQIDKSVANDGSDLEDADGGWTINGAGTVWDHFVKLLAWDMARLRVGVVRVMNCEINTTSNAVLPQTLVTFDGKVSVMGNANGDSDLEDYKGSWYEISDIDNSAITVTDQLFKTTRETNPSQILPAPGDGEKSYTYETDNETTTRIAVPAELILPDPDVYSPVQINTFFRKAIRGTANLKYHTTLTHPSHFTIDNATNEIVLERIPALTDSFFFHWKYTPGP